jgi:hypothetical protein
VVHARALYGAVRPRGSNCGGSRALCLSPPPATPTQHDAEHVHPMRVFHRPPGAPACPRWSGSSRRGGARLRRPHPLLRRAVPRPHRRLGPALDSPLWATLSPRFAVEVRAAVRIGGAGGGALSTAGPRPPPPGPRLAPHPHISSSRREAPRKQSGPDAFATRVSRRAPRPSGQLRICFATAEGGPAWVTARRREGGAALVAPQRECAPGTVFRCRWPPAVQPLAHPPSNNMAV